MNKTPRLCKSEIPYLTHVWNFMSGCENNERGICPIKHCWARSLTERFRNHYPNGFKPTLYPEALLSPIGLKKPARIGIVLMGDLFGDWVDPDSDIGKIPIPIKVCGKTEYYHSNKSLRETVFDVIEVLSQHTFIFLTKAPWNYKKWSPFPDNCWVGVSVVDGSRLLPALDALDSIQCSVRFLSAEPLLSSLEQANHYLPLLFQGTLNWVIIGQQTPVKKATMPKIEWIEEIVKAADKARIPVFLKNNLKPLIVQKRDGQEYAPIWANGGCGTLRQEFPLVVSKAERIIQRKELPDFQGRG